MFSLYAFMFLCFVGIDVIVFLDVIVCIWFISVLRVYVFVAMC